MKPRLVSRSVEPGAALGPALLVAGSEVTPASIRFTPDTDSTDGIVVLGLQPSTVVFGASSIGLDCPFVVIDDSETAAGPGQGAPGLVPPKARIDADEPGWRGLLAREIDLYLPEDLPLFGGRPIAGYFELPRGAGGPHLVIETIVPASDNPKRLGCARGAGGAAARRWRCCQAHRPRLAAALQGA